MKEMMEVNRMVGDGVESGEGGVMVRVWKVGLGFGQQDWGIWL